MSKYNIISCCNHLALDLPGYNINNNFHLWEYHNDWNQRFILMECDDDPGYYNIIIDYTEVTLLVSINQTSLVLKPPSNDKPDDQKFRFIENDFGLYVIECKTKELVLDVAESGIDNGTKVILWKSNGGLNQIWKISITSTIQFPFLNNLNEYAIDFSQLKSDIFLNILEEQGFCIVKNVMTPDEILKSKQYIGEDLLELIDMNKILNDDDDDLLNEYQKFNNMNKDEIIDNWKFCNNNFINKHGLPQGRFAWNLRLNSKVRSIFETVYDSLDLVTGMDLIFFNTGKSISRRVDYWGHCDQNVKRDDCDEDWQCYQSVIAINDIVNDESETTVILPKSHQNFYQTLMEASNSDYSHYIELSLLMRNDHYGDIRKGRYINYKYIKEARRVPLQAGDLLIWNSKTIHQGYKNNGRRLAMPICYEPKSRRAKKSYVLKLKCAIEGYGTTHWASLGKKHGIYLKEIHDHNEATKYNYSSSEGKDIAIPIKECIVPYIIKDEYHNSSDFLSILSLVRDLSFDNIDSRENETILTELHSKMKLNVLKYI